MTEFEDIEIDEASDQYSIEDYLEYEAEDLVGPVRVYKGDLVLDGDFRPEWEEGEADDQYNVIIDGNLKLKGTLDWGASAPNMLFVTGNVEAGTIFLGEAPNVVIKGDVTAKAILGTYGDNGGVLWIGGKTRGDVVIATNYFRMQFAERPNAIVISDKGLVGEHADYGPDRFADALLPDFMKGTDVDVPAVFKAVKAGQPVLKPGAKRK